MNLSIVIPCLNESDTLQICIDKIKSKIDYLKIESEIILSDNGSTDGSLEIAKKNNVKIINVSEKGYGNAVISGIRASKGEYILIADADDSYDFNDLPRFYNKIKNGFDIVQGCRLSLGGGKIERGAMPLSHKYIGNPLFTFMAKKIYKLPFNDVYCGMKIIKKSFFEKIKFFSGGMVFCLEILIKAVVNNAKISELPITLFKDGRINSKSHLRTIKDGLKTLKFILICSPKSMYFIPGFIMTFLLLVHVITLSFDPNFNQLLNKFLIMYLAIIFLISQFFMLGLYSTLRAETLELIKVTRLETFFKFFSLKLSICLFFSLIFLNHFIFHFELFNFILDKNKFNFLIMIDLICINIIFNSFFISLLRVNK
tara:strand:+ start:777 stop:1886 length:1110 start_codon:yes stop_codon:yes gene_type:complete